MNILKSLFGKKFNGEDYISDLKIKISELEKEKKELKFQLEENELEYKDTLIQYESKIEKLTEENLELKQTNKSFSVMFSQIVSICTDYTKEIKDEELEEEDY